MVITAVEDVPAPVRAPAPEAEEPDAVQKIFMELCLLRSRFIGFIE